MSFRAAPRFALAAFALLLAATTACGDSTSATGPDDLVPANTGAAAAAVREAAHPLTGGASDYDALLAMVGDARVVLLGEGTHGTHEFHRERMRITQRLIQEKGFTAIAIEGDWPDADRVNRYARGLGGAASAEESLAGFSGFGSWMWRNTDARDLVRWLRAYDDAQPATGDVGFYGLDVYSLFTSADAVLAYLTAHDPAAAARVRAQYACFDAYRPDPEGYGAAAAKGAASSCQAQAARALEEVHGLPAAADPAGAEARFSVERNAQAVASAEAFFRVQYAGGAAWNLRDRGMAETLDALAAHLGAATGRPAKIVVWAHNTHTGDARKTDAAQRGEQSLGQLMRERYATGAVLVGFFTYTGTVFAAPSWGEAGRVYDVRPELAGSVGDVFHRSGVAGFSLVLRDGGAAAEELAESRLERTIGVVYHPQTERESHYFQARLSEQFDATVFLDRTTAVTPLAP